MSDVFTMNRQADLLDQQGDDVAARVMREGAAQLKSVLAALRELVTLKKLKETAEQEAREGKASGTAKILEYQRRKPFAWEAARRAIEQTQPRKEHQ